MGQFLPGQSGNPKGRPKGSVGGRVQAIHALDAMLSKKGNKSALVNALEAELREHPVRFFKTIIMPLLPKETKLAVENDGVIAWQSLLSPASEQIGGEMPWSAEPEVADLEDRTV